MNRYYFVPGRICLWPLVFASLAAAAAPSSVQENAAEIDVREQLRQQERERALQQQNQSDKDIRLERPSVALPYYPLDEKPCFMIHSLTLKGDGAARFQWALKAAELAKGRCLGARGISLTINKVQNRILEKGFVTTRVMAQEQDLTKGVLTLTLQPGRIDRIAFEQPVSWRARLWNALPASSGDILNLRDIEQGLENFKRVPSVAADIKIEPGQREATSDLVVAWQESRPVRLNLGLDDSGAKSTGKYQGAATLSIDAPFAQNDLFYLNLGKDLLQPGPFASRSHTLSYSIPAGYWLLSASYNAYRYQQNIANTNDILTYSGKSENAQLALSRLLFRNQAHKTTLHFRLWQRHSTNAIDGINIDQQQRRTAGWELGLSQRSYFGNATADANLNWRRGTGLFNARPAPEEQFGGGSARASIFTSDLSLNLPLSSAWRYHTSLRGQWSGQAPASHPNRKAR